MKRKILTAVAGALPMVIMAQGATDLYQLSQTELRGTARFMSMGGAFGALGGDLSTLNQNPAGIGVYRGSEIGVTLDIDIQGSKFTPNQGQSSTMSQTKVACNNFGYVGTTQLFNDIMPTFSWGASYSRRVSFDRVYSGYVSSIGTSLSNYAAYMSQDYAPSELLGTTGSDGYDPFNNPDIPWLSALAYNTYLIYEVGGQYNGLFKNGSAGDAAVNVRQRGSVDEYSINFGGNFANTVYWGLGFGITDLNFTSDTYYDEQIADARIPNADATGVATGNAAFGLGNHENVSGTGFNFKFGLIFKPINELRIGFAVHTPTYYSLTYNRNAWVDYNLQSPDFNPQAQTGYAYTNNDDNPYDYTGYGNWNANLNTPWRLVASIAGVIGGRGIISMDYEYNAYQNMSVGDSWGKFEDVSADVHSYYKASNTLRIGAEYRLTPQWSLRAGYSIKSSPVQTDAYDNRDYIYTSGTNPSYTFDNTIQYITCGLGWRYKGFYADAAYVHKHRESRWSAFTNFNGVTPPEATITDNNNHIVLSVGYKF